VVQISAKLGTGIEPVIQAIIDRIPPPKVNREAPLRALIFDSWYDKYRGALSLIYIQDGAVNVGDEIRTCHTKKTYAVRTLSLLRPQEVAAKKL
jgi:translation elongation factor EF-4